MTKYIFDWQEKSSLMIMEANELICMEGVSDIFHVEFHDYLTFYQDNQAYFYFSENDIKNWEQTGINFLEPGYLEKFLARTKAIREDFYRVIKKIELTKVDKLSDSELLNLFKEYFLSVKLAAGIYLGSQTCGMSVVGEEFQKAVKEDVGDKDAKEIADVLCVSEEIDFIQQEKIDWLSILKNKSVSKAEYARHARKYAANFFNTYKIKSATDYLALRRKTTNIFELEQEISDIYKHVESAKKKRIKISSRVSARASHLSEIIRKQAVDRLKMKNCWQGAEFLALRLFEEIAHRIGIPVSDLFAGYLSGDIDKFLIKHIAVQAQEVKDRKKAFFYHVRNKKISFCSGEEAGKKIKTFFEEQEQGVGRVRGMTACSGRAEGSAKVVLVEGIEEFATAAKEFNEGDILITTMTSPNMVMLMKKAGGVVTNEGGVASHAAIMSRELGKPCIVGTKNATRVFKTGDRVVVDGKKGEAYKI